MDRDGQHIALPRPDTKLHELELCQTLARFLEVKYPNEVTVVAKMLGDCLHIGFQRSAIVAHRDFALHHVQSREHAILGAFAEVEQELSAIGPMLSPALQAKGENNVISLVDARAQRLRLEVRPLYLQMAADLRLGLDALADEIESFSINDPHSAELLFGSVKKIANAADRVAMALGQGNER